MLVDEAREMGRGSGPIPNWENASKMKKAMATPEYFGRWPISSDPVAQRNRIARMAAIRLLVRMDVRDSSQHSIYTLGNYPFLCQ